jgi:predicted Zn-dependent peptidase
MAGVFVLQNASREGIIGQLSFIDLHGLGDRYLEEFVSRVEAVTPEQVRDMTRRYLKVDAMSLAVVGDTAVVREQLVALPQVGAKAAETGPDGAGARAAAAK